MIKRRKKNESMDNVHRVVGNKQIDTVAHVDLVTAAAIQDDLVQKEHLEEVNKDLTDAADSVKSEKEEEPDVPVKNEFTAKLVLDEEVSDFKLAESETKKLDGRSDKVFDPDGSDEHLDYDMFDFIYGLVTDTWPKPLNPLGHRMRKFMYIGSDKYAGDAEDTSDGHSQVASSGDTIEVYANKVTDFSDIEEVCKLYKFTYSGPTPKRNKLTYWDYSFRINVPCLSSGYPYMVEDYFETIGMTLEDVMPADFCKKYREKQSKLEAESQQYFNQKEVDNLVNKAITTAAQDNTEPLEVHLKRLYIELNTAGLTYKKKEIKTAFMNAFDDGEEDED